MTYITKGALNDFVELKKQHGDTWVNLKHADKKIQDMLDTINLYDRSKIKENETTFLAAMMFDMLKSVVDKDGNVDSSHAVFDTAFEYWNRNCMSCEQLKTPFLIFTRELADKPTELGQIEKGFKCFFWEFCIEEVEE